MPPIISIIAAVDQNFLIGNKERLPWHLPADLAYFKKQTLGKPIIMGRKTFQSLGRPLPGRINVILTNQKDFSVEDCIVVSSPQEAIGQFVNYPEIMVIGGAQVFTLFLPIAKRLYLTEIAANFSGDAYFPKYDHNSWKEISRIHHSSDNNNSYPYDFVIYEKL